VCLRFFFRSASIQTGGEGDWGEATEAIGKKLGTGLPPSLIHHSKRSKDGADEDDFDDKRRRNNKGGHYRLENSI